MTLTYERDLDILLPDFHIKIQARMYVRTAGRVRQTDRHTVTHTDNVKTITPIMLETLGVKR